MRLITEITYILLATLLAALLIPSEQQAEYATEPTPYVIEEPQIDSDTVRLVFGGDFMQHMPQVRAAEQSDGSYDYTTSTRYVASLFRSADIAVINLETTLSSTGRYSGYPCFESPAAIADAFVDMGIDIALLANNHCCDRWGRGIDSTIAHLQRRNIAHTGAFRDSTDRAQNSTLYLKSKDIRFALINYTYGTNGIPVPKGKYVNIIDTVAIKQELKSICDSVDCVIACMHWGNEYERKQNIEQRRLAALLRREGVDIIIGSHPHVIQPFCADSSHVVFYSLGNFVSNQRSRYSDGGILADIEVIRCDTIEGLRYRAKAHPIWVLCPEYKVLPRSVADTLQMSDTERKQYECFISDTEALLRQ